MKKKINTAVALRYPPEADAPFIAAKASGALADRMKAIARENNIPVVENKLIANILSVQQIGQCIPEETWQAVAEIFVYIQKLERCDAEEFHKD